MRAWPLRRRHARYSSAWAKSKAAPWLCRDFFGPLRRSGHEVGRLLAGVERVEIVERAVAHRGARLDRRAAEMRQQERVGQRAVAGVGARLAGEDVEPR